MRSAADKRAVKRAAAIAAVRANFEKLTDDERAALIAELGLLIAKSESQAATTAPSDLREVDITTDFAQDMVRALQGDAGAAERVADRDRRQKGSAPPPARWVRGGTAALDELQEHVWVLGEGNLTAWQKAGAPRQVCVRWDAVPGPLRPAVASLASSWSDRVRPRKPAGRPRELIPK